MRNDNRRIAVNTGILYVRMLLIMAITIYTSRILLKALGITDYGIYNGLTRSCVQQLSWLVNNNYNVIRIKDSHLAEEYFLLSTPRFYELEMKLILFQIQNLQGYKELSVLFFLCHSMIF